MSALRSIIQPKRPIGTGWRRMSSAQIRSEYPVEAWAHDANNILALSGVEVVKDAAEPGPEYHLSVSAFGERCSSADALWALAQFDLLSAEEDNHVPGGKVRNFWRPVAERLIGVECPCKADESAIIEDKGDYVWRGARR